MKDMFSQADCDAVIQRIMQLTPNSQALWGKMTVAQMVQHLCVSYEMVYTQKHPKPNAFVRFLLKTLVKQAVVGPKPYPKNTATAKAFKIQHEPNLAEAQSALIQYIQKVQAEGKSAFEGRESLSFGPLTAAEWNVLFYKHLDHHLAQFGV